MCYVAAVPLVRDIDSYGMCLMLYVSSCGVHPRITSHYNLLFDAWEERATYFFAVLLLMPILLCKRSRVSPDEDGAYVLLG